MRSMCLHASVCDCVDGSFFHNMEGHGPTVYIQAGPRAPGSRLSRMTFVDRGKINEFYEEKLSCVSESLYYYITGSTRKTPELFLVHILYRGEDHLLLLSHLNCKVPVIPVSYLRTPITHSGFQGST